MKLTIEGIRDRGSFERAGIALPAFDVAAMQEEGRRSPRWLHIGAGNLFRAFVARVADDMLADGQRWPVTAVVPRSPEVLDGCLAPHDLLTLVVTLNPDGSRDERVVAGMSEALTTRREEGLARALEVIADPGLTLVSLTITEKGYALHGPDGGLSAAAAAAVLAGPHTVQDHAMGLLAALLLRRFEAGAAPLSLLSLDNFSHNGDALREAVLTIARGWEEEGTAPAAFVDWLLDRTQVAFPITVIDKITPRPSAELAAELAGRGIEDLGGAPDAADTAGAGSSGTAATAAFVNTEPAEYLVLEDAFAAGRPPFEDYGAHVVAREACDAFESMKVTTCLNPLHTALAIAGCLLRIPTIDAAVADPALAALVRRLGYDEGLPVVSDPGFVAPADFLREVIEVRFANPHLPDSPARIAMDTSQKMPIRFGRTLVRYRDRGLDLASLTGIPLVIALWCRYLLGVADDGAPFQPSADPRLEELGEHLTGLALGTDDARAVREALAPILADATLFGLDLTTTPLAARVEDLVLRLLAGPGAVRTTLDEELLP